MVVIRGYSPFKEGFPIRIVSAVANDDHTLLIDLKSQHKVIYDMKPRLKTLRFGGISDLDKFKQMRVEHGNTLVWDGLCQITIDEIMVMLER